MADKNFKFCTACGRKVALNAQFCAGCGTALGAKEKSVQGTSRASQVTVDKIREYCEHEAKMAQGSRTQVPDAESAAVYEGKITAYNDVIAKSKQLPVNKIREYCEHEAKRIAKYPNAPPITATLAEINKLRAQARAVHIAAAHKGQTEAYTDVIAFVKGEARWYFY